MPIHRLTDNNLKANKTTIDGKMRVTIAGDFNGLHVVSDQKKERKTKFICNVGIRLKKKRCKIKQKQQYVTKWSLYLQIAAFTNGAGLHFGPSDDSTIR